MREFNEAYHPYQATAESVVQDDERDAEFIKKVFPKARHEQIEALKFHIAGRVHDGIEIGLILGDSLHDVTPGSLTEAYSLGIEEGKGDV